MMCAGVESRDKILTEAVDTGMARPIRATQAGAKVEDLISNAFSEV